MWVCYWYDDDIVLLFGWYDFCNFSDSPISITLCLEQRDTTCISVLRSVMQSAVNRMMDLWVPGRVCHGCVMSTKYVTWVHQVPLWSVKKLVQGSAKVLQFSCQFHSTGTIMQMISQDMILRWLNVMERYIKPVTQGCVCVSEWILTHPSRGSVIQLIPA